MRNIVFGAIVGIVIGMVAGTSVIAPRLDQGRLEAEATPDTDAADRARAVLPKDLVPPKHRWTLVSAYRFDLPHYGTLATRVGDKMRALFPGEIDIRSYMPDTLVRVSEMLEAVREGSLEAVFAPPGMWVRESPVLGLMGGAPFGLPAPALLAWYDHGGGAEFHARAYDSLGLVGLACGLDGARLPGWYRYPVTGPDSFDGLRVAASGLPALVLERLGAKTQSLPPSDLPAALKLRVVDAVHGLAPVADLALGLDNFARYTYWPAWHHQGGFVDLIINPAAWDVLTPATRDALRAVCDANLRHALTAADRQVGPLKQLQKRGFTAKPWPAPVMAALLRAWNEVIAAQSTKDPQFSKAYTSQIAFRDTLAIWRDLADLPPGAAKRPPVK